MHARAALLQPANHLQEIFEWQIRMQAANDVEFERTFAHALFRARINFIQRKIVSAGRIGVAAKRAELAMRHANICRSYQSNRRAAD